MFKKTLLTAGIATSLLSTAVFANPSDGLTIVNNNVGSPISVVCNAINGQDIQPGVPGHFPWLGIVIMFHSNQVDCDFFLKNGPKIGSAHINIAATNPLNPTGLVNPTFVASNYSVIADKGWNAYNANMQVTISKK